MATKNQSQQRTSSSSKQSKKGDRNPQRDSSRQKQDSKSHDRSDRDFNHDIKSGMGTGSYHGGSYEGGYSNSDYRDNDLNQDNNEGQYTRRHNDRDRHYDYDRGSSRDYNQSRQGQPSTYGTYGSGSSHFSSDPDRHDRGQVGSSFNRNTEGSSRWGEERQWGQTTTGGFRGKGPKGYQRSDERIREDINDRLSDSDDVDATDIEVSVNKGEVTLTGTVEGRREKRRAEDIAEAVSGVKNVENRIRLRQQGSAKSSD